MSDKTYAERFGTPSRPDGCPVLIAAALTKAETENATLRADIHAHEQINRQLIEDKRRLDFLGLTKCAYYYEGPRCWRINEDKLTDSDTLRAAIDAARNRSDHIGDINEMMQKGKEAQP